MENQHNQYIGANFDGDLKEKESELKK